MLLQALFDTNSGHICMGMSLVLLECVLAKVHTGLRFYNWTLQYELLDEMMDFGYPQYTEAKILSEFIKTDAYRMEVNQRPPMAVTNAVSWRMEGIKYKKNEVSIYCIRLYQCLGRDLVLLCRLRR